MNREIKFRAWHKTFSPKESDSLVKSINGMQGVKSISISNTGKQYVYLWNWKDPCPIEDVELLQFTGLHDKTGKEIYEGDILQFSDKWEWYRGKFGGGFLATKEERDEVLQDHVKYPYERRTVEIPNGYEWLLSTEIQRYWEVIGNIFEHPHLLEVK